MFLPNYQPLDICYTLNIFYHRKKTAEISESSLCLEGVTAPCHSFLASEYLVSKAPRTLYVVSLVSLDSEEQTQDIILRQHRSIELGALGLFLGLKSVLHLVNEQHSAKPSQYQSEPTLQQGQGRSACRQPSVALGVGVLHTAACSYLLGGARLPAVIHLLFAVLRSAG